MKQSQIKAILLAGVALSGIGVWFLTPSPDIQEQKVGMAGLYSDSSLSLGFGQQAFLFTLQDLREWHGISDVLKHDMFMSFPSPSFEKGHGRTTDNAGIADTSDDSDMSGDADAKGATNVPKGNHALDSQETPDISEEEMYPVPVDLNAGYLVLVNKQHTLADNYKPEDLKDILYFATDRDAAGRFLRAEAADAFHGLVEDAKDQGITLVLTTGYRSYGFQSTLYNNYVAKDGQAEADRYSARPGTSEHQTGLAADVSAPSVEYRLTEKLADTTEGRWLVENISRFGFILRYPQGKEQITGYLYEPWHIRYVGNPAAEYIMAHGMTLEEYLLLIQ